MRRLLAVAAIGMVVMMTLAGCGGGGTDGGWVASGSGWAYYIDISNGTDPVDYAFYFNGNGQLVRDYGTISLHNDGTLEVDGFVDGVLKDCTGCPYHLTNGNLVIDYTYQPYGGNGPVSGTLTLSPGDASIYQNDVQGLKPQGS